MFRKAQIKFVCFVMLILFVIFVAFFSGAYYFNYESTIELIENNMSQVLIDYKYNQKEQQNKTIFYYADNSRPLNYDTDYFTKNQIEELCLKCRPEKTGTVYQNGNYFYFGFEHDGKQVIMICDMSLELLLFTNTINRLTISLAISYVCLFVVAYFFSFRVFRPIKENFEKQKQFISDASHELKTPLTIISANNEVLQENCEKNQEVYHENIKSQINRLDELINDMLTLAKLDEKGIKLNKEHFDISQEITDNVLPFDALAFENGKKISLNVKENVLYFGDRNSVKKIVNILISNAIKYSNDNSEIKVDLTQEGKQIKFSVLNEGSKVLDKDSNKVFERFYRGDSSRARTYGGSGLGLSIAKSIATKNKWKITAISVFEQSMQIIVTF